MDIIQSNLKLETTVYQASGYKRQLSDKKIINLISFIKLCWDIIICTIQSTSERNTDAVNVKSDIEHFERRILNIRNKISSDSDVEQYDIFDSNTSASSNKRRKLGLIKEGQP